MTRVIEDEALGYRRLDPMPSASEFERFYQSAYYELLRSGGRAPDLRRLLAGGDDAERERAWLRATLYPDIADALEQHGGGNRVLDVGCGHGELVEWLGGQGFDARGIEPSEEAAALARERGLAVRTATLEELPETEPAYDAVLLLNVLEHVPDAAGMLRRIRALLAGDGLLWVRAPNDFNPLQLAAQEKLGVEPWWVAVPDHVNYFDVRSLGELLRREGFEPLDVQADFPMELFLLMGHDYVNRPEVGTECHRMRIEAEQSMAAEVRRELYRSFAAAGIGRNAHVLARMAE